jgi:voltage-gated potassium channel
MNVGLIHRLVTNRGSQLVTGAVVCVLVAGATLVLLVERDAEGANITSFGDALWWSATTMTTVGYGDRYPTTPAGRGVAVALMVLGIAALSVVTATIAAFLVEEREGPSLEDVMKKLDELQSEVAALRDSRGDP